MCEEKENESNDNDKKADTWKHVSNSETLGTPLDMGNVAR